MSDPSTVPPPASPPRLLRRSRTDRVASGVCGGLGEYFGLDPVLFRVLFAVTAFFGAGIVAYLLAWALIPEQGAAVSSVDRWAADMRRRRVPAGWAIGIGALIVWAALFSWWSPWPFVPVAAATAILVIALTRRTPPAPPAPPAPPSGLPSPGTGPSTDTAPVDLAKTAPLPPADWTAPAEPAQQAQQPQSQLGAWIAESREAGRRRRARSRPVLLSVILALVATLGVMAAIDAARGIAIPAYFAATLIIVGTGLLTGLVLRRTPWSTVLLLVPAVLGLFVFSGTRASLHDGSGDSTVTPRSVADLKPDYRQAFGRTTFDLSAMRTPDVARTVHVRQAAGQVRVILPRTLPVLVRGDLHLGAITVDDVDVASGVNVSRDTGGTGSTGSTATGPVLTIDVDIQAGNLRIEHVG